MAFGYKMKSRGIAPFVAINIGGWSLPRVFTAEHLLPYCKEKFPAANVSNARGALKFCMARGLVSHLSGTTRPMQFARTGDKAVDEVLDEAQTIDRALEALAEVERILVAHKAAFSKMAEIKKLLG